MGSEEGENTTWVMKRATQSLGIAMGDRLRQIFWGEQCPTGLLSRPDHHSNCGPVSHLGLASFSRPPIQ
jgi:hypothetical protein